MSDVPVRAESSVVSSSRAVDLDLDQIEARANAATARPWDHKGWHRSPHGESYAVWRGKPEGSYPIAQTERGLQGWHDAEFIAHAREDVPRLVAEVRRLRAEVVTLECERAPQELVDHLAAERDAAHAEAEQLREEASEEKRRAEQSRSVAYQRLVEDRDKYLEAWQASVAEAARVREALQAIRDILDWLTSMGEPTHEALETRRVVTLGDIISRARAALRALDAALGSHPDESENPTKEMDHA